MYRNLACQKLKFTEFNNMAGVSRCQFEAIHTRTLHQLLQVLKTKYVETSSRGTKLIDQTCKCPSKPGNTIHYTNRLSNYTPIFKQRYCMFHTSSHLSGTDGDDKNSDDGEIEGIDATSEEDVSVERLSDEHDAGHENKVCYDYDINNSSEMDALDLEISSESLVEDGNSIVDAVSDGNSIVGPISEGNSIVGPISDLEEKLENLKKGTRKKKAVKISRLADDTDSCEEDDGQEEEADKKIITVLEPKDYLLEESIEKFFEEKVVFYDKGHTCFHTVCPKFGKMAMKKRLEEDKLYINYLSGYFKCMKCGTQGNWSHLKDNINSHLSKRINRTRQCFKNVYEIDKDVTEMPADVFRQIEGSEEFATLSQDQFETILSIFDWHSLRKTTFSEFGVRYKMKDNKYCIMFPIQSITGVTVAVRVQSGHVTEDGDIKIGPMYTYPKTLEMTTLFGWQNRPSKKTLVITVGEVNAMAIAQETGLTTLSLRNMTHLPQEILPDLEGFNKIILWIGTDIKAWENTKTFAKKLNDKRCYIFRPNTVQKMPVEMLRTGKNIGNVMEKARLISHRAILTFNNLRQEVYSELAHYKQVAGIPWKRYSKLNDLLKGHRRGELTILTGPTGCGKTTFVSDYSLDLCMQGVNTLWGSFEISNVRLAKVMMQQFAGKNLAKNLHDFETVADEFSTLPLYFMTYFGQEHVNKVIEAMSHAVYVHDISHIIVDNLQFMMGMDYSEKNRFIKQDHIVSLFRSFATEKNCHVTLIIHPRKVNEGEELSTASIFGSAKVSQEADNILLIQDQRLTKPTSRKYLQITKNRFDGDLGVMVMSFNKESLSFSVRDRKKNVDKRIESHDAENDDVEA